MSYHDFLGRWREPRWATRGLLAMMVLVGLAVDHAGAVNQPVSMKASTSQKWKEPYTGMWFVQLPEGCAIHGRDEPLLAQPDPLWQAMSERLNVAADEHPAHEVCVSSLWMGVHEVSAVQWRKVMGRWPPDGRGKQPASGMDWEEVQAFIKALNARTRGKTFALPTEAQWQHACLAGQGDVVPDSAKKVTQAWYHHGWGVDAPQAWAVNAVGRLPANPWGLHDMLGNVWEWTADGYDANAYHQRQLYDPRHEATTEHRVIKGGSFRSKFTHIRCGKRASWSTKQNLPQLGFRLVWQVRTAP